MTAPACIALTDLQVVLAAFKLRNRSGGRTCLLAATTPGQRLECDCSSGRRVPNYWRAQAIRMGQVRYGVGPISRGHIGRVFERTARQGGRAEVLRTWGAGIRALRAEPRYVLHGGAAA